MAIFIILLLLLIFYDFEFPKDIHSLRENDYISQKQANCIKGFATCVIVLDHLVAVTEKEVWIQLLTTCGDMMVAIFFFYSGYGMLYQYKRKGESYLLGFVQKKFRKILLPWMFLALIVPIYYTLGAKSTVALEPAFRVQNILEQLGEWVPNGWFLLVLFLYQLVFYGLARLFYQKTNMLIIGYAIFVAVYIVIMHSLGMGYWWYYRCHCVVIGMLWCEKKDILLSVFKKHFGLWWTGVFFSVVSLFIYSTFRNSDYTTTAILLVTFVVLVQLTCMKAKLENPILEWLGNLSMEIYLIHGLVLGFLRSSIISISNVVFYGLLVFLFTIIIAVGFKKIFARFESILNLIVIKKEITY